MRATREQCGAVLDVFGLRDADTVEALGAGLINDTFAVRARGAEWVVQRVHEVFSPQIHLNIAAVTEHLASKRIATPMLRRTVEGSLWAEIDGRVWRAMTRLRGVSFDRISSPQQALSAGASLGAFHRALEDLEHSFVGLRAGVHDTPTHLAALREALEARSSHRLYAAVAPVAEALLKAADGLPDLESMPVRVVHGDPKFNNILFEGREGSAAHQAVGLIDLDTVAPMQLHLELGDAWRSWCNPRGEDEPHALFDVDVFDASLRGYESSGPQLSADERRALVFGVEIIALELSARFLADALNERYFGWDRDRFASSGEHNLVRARGQWSLYEAAVTARGARERRLLR